VERWYQERFKGRFSMSSPYRADREDEEKPAKPAEERKRPRSETDDDPYADVPCTD
jgi:hypothetical protein